MEDIKKEVYLITRLDLHMYDGQKEYTTDILGYVHGHMADVSKKIKELEEKAKLRGATYTIDNQHFPQYLFDTLEEL